MGWQQNCKYLWIHKKMNYLEESKRTQVCGYSSPLQWEQIRVRRECSTCSQCCTSHKWCFQFSQVLNPSSARLHIKLRASIFLSMAAVCTWRAGRSDRTASICLQISHTCSPCLTQLILLLSAVKLEQADSQSPTLTLVWTRKKFL